MNAHAETPETEALILDRTALVGHIVRETMTRVPSHVDRDDLTSAGLLALVQAARAFDADRGVPFNRYAATRIRGAIVDELRSIDWASRSVRRRSRELEGVRAQLASVLGRAATPAEVAQAAGMTVAEVSANDDDVARAQVLSLQGSATTPIDELVPHRAPSPEDLLEQQERLVYQARLRESHPGLDARLLRRPGGPDGQVTLMETYAMPGGVSEAVQARIDEAATCLAAWLRGARHTEVFEPLV